MLRWNARVALLSRRRDRLALAALAAGYFVFWAALLTIGKFPQTIHYDSAEAYAWGRQLAWGYGKHPPMSGAITWLWFSLFPARDWAMYALAMAVTGATFALLWALARKIVDRRRALLASGLLLVYPILNFKGYKYNADLALLPFVVLVVLVFILAFERRTLVRGIALGLACAAAVLTKYWGVWAIVAIGVASLLHPDRRAFFRSPVPYAAAAAFLAAMAQHVMWLVNHDFTPFHYAAIYSDAEIDFGGRSALGASVQPIVLLLPPAVAGLIALWPLRRRRRSDEDVKPADQARNLWVIAAVLAFATPFTAVLLSVHTKSDWDIPMYTIVPLAVLAWPSLRVRRNALGRAALLVLLYCAVATLLLATPLKLYWRPGDFQPFDEIARAVTDIWHQKVGTRLPVIAGRERHAARISFYSPDHPVLFTEADPKLAPWFDTRTLSETGFVGICAMDGLSCIARVKAWRPDGEQAPLSSKRVGALPNAPEDHWFVWLAPPKK